MIDLIGHILDFGGVLIMAWVAWKVAEIAHQNNSMRHELETAAKAEGNLEGREEEREEAKDDRPTEAGEIDIEDVESIKVREQ